MKKLLLGSLVLALFSFLTILLQISCQKDVNAQTNNYTLLPATSSTLGGVIIGPGLNITNNGVLSVNGSSGIQLLSKIVYQKYYTSGVTEIWLANYDGSNQQKINITLPSGFEINEDGSAKLSPDGLTVFFDAITTTQPYYTNIYSCKIDGTNISLVIAHGTAESAAIGGAY